MKLSNQEWRERLSDEEYRVCREKGTERPFTGKLLNENSAGTYSCKCCGVKLFEAEHKFDSRCGWPSFYAESAEKNIRYETDLSHGMTRVEIICKHCDAHLGHVFEDGPEPSGQRYCVNSVSLNFEPKE
ncbi:peptide-methionine (R)-S-oxide reductase [Alteromonadaceae bacterium M269]|nr:peptide-methionine (R)-S-oxide reductase [Alteromonadaceae bacterium M269]